MSVESYRESPGKFDSRTLSRETQQVDWAQRVGARWLGGDVASLFKVAPLLGRGRSLEDAPGGGYVGTHHRARNSQTNIEKTHLPGLLTSCRGLTDAAFTRHGEQIQDVQNGEVITRIIIIIVTTVTSSMSLSSDSRFEFLVFSLPLLASSMSDTSPSLSNNNDNVICLIIINSHTTTTTTTTNHNNEIDTNIWYE